MLLSRHLIRGLLVASWLVVAASCDSSSQATLNNNGPSNTKKFDVDEPETDPKPTPKQPDKPNENQIAGDNTKTTNPDVPENPDRPVPQDDEIPFRRRPAPEFPENAQWINSAPLQMKDLRGKFVILDFWTYCCINCMHILPELKKLEHKYANELVVIGVHSAKFEGEKDTKNIEEAVLRYEIEHPVVNDPEHEIWDSFFVSSWPSIRLIDPQGNLIAQHSGEFTFEQMDEFFREHVLPPYRKKKLIDEAPLNFELAANRQQKTPLRFPGKLLADESSDRLFISDSNHNRIVITRLDGTLIESIGSGAIGKDDGDFAKATFNKPQGMALKGETLYVADTENHMLRKVDLAAKKVTTLSGNGTQSRGVSDWPGLRGATQLPERFVGEPATMLLNSPWDLWIHGDGLYIAMAGPHQIWKMTLDEKEIGLFAGNGREDIVDGPLAPSEPYEAGYSSFAQPSGLASDGTWLFVADSEGSSVRAVPFDATKEVRTVVGSAHLPRGRLFAFGDKDGGPTEALLQHALGVLYHDRVIYVADTYNNKIKAVDAETGETKNLVGSGKPALNDDEPAFDEPSGLAFAKGILYVADTNNHAIRTIDLATKKVGTLKLIGLRAPTPPAKKPTFPRATLIDVEKTVLKAENGAVKVALQLGLPAGWKLNSQAPLRYLVEVAGEASPFDKAKLGELKFVDPPTNTLELTLPVTGEGMETLKISLTYYYCQEAGGGVCKIGSAIWNAPVTVSAEGLPVLRLEHKIPE